METYEGIYENGVARFFGPVALPECTKVKVVAETESEKPPYRLQLSRTLCIAQRAL
jgi:predicted DNA-binding antitoxin AbrB/MazE fold protein